MFLKEYLASATLEKSGQILYLLFLLLIPFSIAGSYLFLVPAFLIFLFCRGWRSFDFFQPYFVCFLVFTLFSVASSFFAFKPALSFNDNRELLLFILLPLGSFFLRRQELRERSVKIILVSFALAAFAGIWQAVKWGVTIDNRIKGFTSHWLTYSGLLMLVFVYFGIVLLEKRRTANSLLLTTALIFCASAIFISLTRSVWVAIFCSLMFYLLICRKKFFLIFLLLTGVLLLIAPKNIQKRVISIVNPADPSNSDRLRIYYSGFKIIRDFPLLGVGSDNIPEIIKAKSALYKHPAADHVEMHLHNTYLQLFAERGIFAFCSWMLAMFFLLKKSWLLQKENIYFRALFFTLTAFLIQAFFEYNFGDSEMKFLLFYLIALTFSSQQGVYNEYQQKKIISDC